MAIPSFLTSTVSSISGEFVNTGETFISSIGFNPSDYPESLINIADSVKLPVVNEYQKIMMQTMLGANGRVELFNNPFSDDFNSLREKLNQIIASPSGNPDSDSGGIGENPVVLACEDLLETLDHFESHTDRLCGLVEPSSDEDSQLPTLEKALAVGSSLFSAHTALDSVPTNEPQLSMFSSFFSGRKQIDSIKNILNNTADSNLLASAISDVSKQLITIAENDVANYTVGLKKLKRLGVSNIVFNSRDKQVESELFKLITSDFTQGLFDDDTSKRNEEEVKRQQARLDARNNSRGNTSSPGLAQTFGDVKELFMANGLFEGIEMNVVVWNKLRTLYPETSVGFLNNELAHIARIVPVGSPMTQEALDGFFSSLGTREPFVLAILRDYLAKNHGSSTIARGLGDVWFDGAKKFGSISKLAVFAAHGGNSNDPGLTDNFGPVIQEYDNGPWRPCTEEEQEIMKRAIVTRVGHPLIGKIMLDVYGNKETFYLWSGSLFRVPVDNPPPLPYPWP